MPLALLLHDAFGTWQRDVAKLAGWNQLVDLEDTLLARARGLFLVRWFGPGVPTLAGDVRVAIANLDALAARYAELRRQALRVPRLNLTEPLAGITGTMVGALLAPTSSMMLMAVIEEEMPKWFTTLAAVLNWLTAGALGALVFAVGVPLAAIGLPFVAVAAEEKFGIVHRFLGRLADLFVAARELLEQLIGPREKVRNPLLVQILGVLDNLATLVPFLFALGAFVITWIGPKLAALAQQLDIMIPLARNVFAIVGSILIDLFDRLEALYAGKHSPWAILQGVMWVVRQWLALVIDQFVGLFGIAAPAFEKVPAPPAGSGKTDLRGWLRIQRVLGDAFDKVLPFLKQMTTGNWLVKRILEFAVRLGKIADILTSLKKAPPKKQDDGWVASAKGMVKETVIGRLKASAPAWPKQLVFPKTPDIGDFPSAAEIFARESFLAERRWVQPDIVAAFAKPDGGTLFAPGPEGEKSLQRLQRQPVDPFAAERKALPRGRKRDELLAQAQAIESQLRSMLFAVIDNLLPPAVAAQVPKLQGLLWELDESMYGKKAEFPVRDLPGGDRLSVKVERVRLRAPGMKHGVVGAWGKHLKVALEKQVYRTERVVPA